MGGMGNRWEELAGRAAPIFRDWAMVTVHRSLKYSLLGVVAETKWVWPVERGRDGEEERRENYSIKRQAGYWRDGGWTQSWDSSKERELIWKIQRPSPPQRGKSFLRSL